MIDATRGTEPRVGGVEASLRQVHALALTAYGPIVDEFIATRSVDRHVQAYRQWFEPGDADAP